MLIVQYGREAAGWRREKTSHCLFHSGLGWGLPGDWGGSPVFGFLSWPGKSAPVFPWSPNSFFVGSHAHLPSPSSQGHSQGCWGCWNPVSFLLVRRVRGLWVWVSALPLQLGVEKSLSRTSRSQGHQTMGNAPYCSGFGRLTEAACMASLEVWQESGCGS